MHSTEAAEGMFQVPSDQRMILPRQATKTSRARLDSNCQLLTALFSTRILYGRYCVASENNILG